MLLTVDEAAEELRISRDTVYRLINAGKIPTMRWDHDGAVRIPRELLWLAIVELSGDWARLVQPPERRA